MGASGQKKPDSEALRKKLPMHMRVKAWWHGNELHVRQRSAESSEGGQPANQVPRRDIDRLTLLQELWGAGSSSPGDGEHLLQMVKPLGLDPAMTVVDLGAGLGALARTMVEHFGPWVQGLESDKELAEAGAALSEAAGMGKKAEVVYFNPEQHAYRPSTADCVVSKEFLFQIKDKDRMLQNVHTLLKDRGQFLFTDYILAEGVKAEDVQDLLQHERGTPHLWDAERYQASLDDNKFDVRINEDLSEDYSALVTGPWSSFARTNLIKELTADSGQSVVREAELWAGRMRAMAAGQLKVQRFYAIKKFSAAAPLTDW